MSRTTVLILGTASPRMTAQSAQTSLAILVDDQAYCVDCGSGMMRRAVEAVAQGYTQLSWNGLTRMFITHLHPDHTVDLPAFLISPWVLARTATPQVYGPKGTAQLAQGLVDLYHVGLHELEHHGPHPIPRLTVDCHPMETGIIYEDELISVEAFPVQHGNLETYGLRFVTPDKIVVFSADTCPVPILEEKAKNCDILIHEVYSEDSLKNAPQRYADYFPKVHTSAREIGHLANKTNPGLVVLTHHMALDGFPHEHILTELREIYDGPAVLAKDLDAFT